MPRSPITCHVLDSSIGKPAAGVRVRLLVHRGAEIWESLDIGVTDTDGRCMDLLSPSDQRSEQSVKLEAGLYKIIFETKVYFDKAGKSTFYPWVEIPFTVINPNEHHHIPLLISPFSYTTYRGS
ncbi:transthyretin [Lactifluus volemus]|nr:transthyretin [Lactifluus volemus]